MSKPRQLSVAEMEEIGVFEDAQQLVVRDDSSYSLASSEATTVRGQSSNRNSCEIRSSRSSIDTNGSKRNSLEIRASRSSGDVPSSRSRPTSKGSDGKTTSPRSEKSDHGSFTVEGFAGAWEAPAAAPGGGGGFSGCDYTGAWESEVTQRHSCSSTDTPPAPRRSLVIDPEMGIIEDSFNTDVFLDEPKPAAAAAMAAASGSYKNRTS